MENPTIELETENGEKLGFRIDAEVMNGLCLTHSKDKVEENIHNFNIDIEVLAEGIATKMSKINNVAIVTILANSERKHQYLVRNDLDIEKMKNDSSGQIPDQIKSLIIQAHQLSQ
ncbi:hypothetical protein [Autumnicola musiva]|uniref:Uncharacterized protein n=1 Tax=Autumnicola musiva TaxID=3075589 RepID=A0ABU3D6L0_9FLAO|nr:hypothetical protein [Zunongwangia sp. F117]MDT0677167.1 hypothetical protein [Zunongwangia sp. F117]